MGDDIDALVRGRKAYFDNPDRLVNPYPGGTREYNDFERGWVQALKGSGGGAISRAKVLGSSRPLPPPSPADNERDRSAREYARASGRE